MHRILVILPNNLGDVIMTLPMLQALKLDYPDCHITFMVESGYEGGLLKSKHCDRIVFIPRNAVKSAAKSDTWQMAPELLGEVIATVKKTGCDEVINLSQHQYCSFIATLAGTEKIRGRRFLREGNHAIDDAWSQYLYAIPFSRTCNALHATDVYCRIAGVRNKGSSASVMTVTDDELAWGSAYLSKIGYDAGRKKIILQPGAAYASKRWPQEYFIILGRMLVAEGYAILITGARSESALARTIAANIGEHCHVTAGELSFRETIVICSLCTFVVCGDTAIMHAASALGKKVYAFFGPTSPVETGPYGTGHYLFAGECGQRPCFKTDCRSPACMRSITPDVVFAYIKGLQLNNKQRCSVLTTCFSDGIWQCRPVDNQPNPYYDAPAASLTHKAFDPGYAAHGYTVDSVVGNESMAFVQRCMVMEQTLVIMRNNPDSALLERFDQLRKDADAASGIVAFWNAVLNIRLNSVPLLDPIAALGGSITACRDTYRQITRCLSL